jgi:SPX domain protein involved in polyphosphate accumulation
VYDFINAKLSEIDARILYCERTIQTLQKNPSMASDANYSIMDEALTEILFDVNDLSRFTRVNFTAIQKILKKHDKWTHLNLKQEFVRKLREKPLDKQRFDVAIIYISALHDICRNRGKQSPGNSASGGDQNAFERATAKYWIHPDNITEVKAIIMLHLPVLIFNKDKKWEPSDSAISSTYFDNPNFDLYTGRLQRDEGAEAIRFRWYVFFFRLFSKQTMILSSFLLSKIPLHKIKGGRREKKKDHLLTNQSFNFFNSTLGMAQ